MSQSLITASLGPVQPFIAAARRTSDLWVGSELFSSLSRAAARAAHDGGATLIFPVLPEDPAEWANVHAPNVILAVTPKPAAVAKAAEAAAARVWNTMVDNAWKQHSKFLHELTWNAQAAAPEGRLPPPFEFNVAWTPLEETAGGYARSRDRVAWLLRGRKALRDFPQTSGAGAGRPKGSLDGERETVLDEEKIERPGPLRLGKGEQLDLLGVVKRHAGRDARFPSVPRIAGDPWVRAVAKSAGFAALKTACEDLARQGLTRESAFADFPYSGSALFVSRHRPLEDELEETCETKAAITRVTNALKTVTGTHGAPDPYMAILVADGDHISTAISQLKEIPDHQAFSRALSSFAGEARVIVGSEHGACVYAGGDDVMALLPLDGALACARRLRDAFARIATEGPFAPEAKVAGITTSLSVGIGIGHCMEPLEDLLALARDAEKLAKNRPRDATVWPAEVPRNGLAIAFSARGQMEVSVRDNWARGEASALDARLATFAANFNDDTLPAKLGHDLRLLALDYEGWTKNAAPAIEADLARILSLKKLGKLADRRIDILADVQDAAQLRARADELVLASRFKTSFDPRVPRGAA